MDDATRDLTCIQKATSMICIRCFRLKEIDKDVAGDAESLGEVRLIPGLRSSGPSFPPPHRGSFESQTLGKRLLCEAHRRAASC